jgi:hypothetical protein
MKSWQIEAWWRNTTVFLFAYRDLCRFLRPAFLVLGEKWLSIKVLTLLMDALVLAILNACGVKVIKLALSPSLPSLPPTPQEEGRSPFVLLQPRQGICSKIG